MEHENLYLTFLYILFSFFLVGLNGFFVAAEFAIVKVRRSRLEELADKGVAAARISILCVDQLDEYLSATQLGITLVSLGLGWVGEESFYNLFAILWPDLVGPHNQTFHLIAVGVSFFIITLLHVVLGELVPKSMAIQKAEHITLLISTPLSWFYKIAKPLIICFTMLANFILRLCGYANNDEAPLSEEELKIVMRESHEDGVISESEAQIINKAFEFSDKRALDIMISSDKVQYVSLQRSVEENLDVARSRKFTRFPLSTGGINDIFGIIHIKDAWHKFDEEKDNSCFEQIARPAIFIDPFLRQDRILKIFKQQKSHMAIVRDPQSRKVLGVVTLEDIMEELVGDIQDEHGN